MTIKDLKTVLFKNINDDFDKNKDAYMFYLYPLIFNIKTNQFNENCYSLFSKIKKETVKKYDVYKIKNYLKNDYYSDIKIILKTLFLSSYLNKKNEYALYYIKKLTKKQSTMNNINLIYRLLSDVKNSKNSGGALGFPSKFTLFRNKKKEEEKSYQKRLQLNNYKIDMADYNYDDKILFNVIIGFIADNFNIDIYSIFEPSRNSKLVYNNEIGDNILLIKQTINNKTMNLMK